MARKVTKNTAGKLSTSSRKTKKIIDAKSTKARKLASNRRPRKASRRSSADIAKLKKVTMQEFKSGKSTAALSEELGVSRPYIYVLENRA